MGCNIRFDKIKIEPCQPQRNAPHYSFTQDKCYKDGEYFGEIISATHEIISVKIDNGNIYMTGQIQTFLLSQYK